MAKMSYKELKAAAEKLSVEVEAARLEEVKAVAQRCVDDLNEFKITLDDLRRAGYKFSGEPETKKSPQKDKTGSDSSQHQYKDPESGGSWAGRGRQPAWLKEKLAQGRKLEEFKIA
jgi:DNA-binding protein H-NS